MSEQSRFTCSWGWHFWEKWSAPKHVKVRERLWTENDNIPPTESMREVQIQDRFCAGCGLYQSRIIKMKEVH